VSSDKVERYVAADAMHHAQLEHAIRGATRGRNLDGLNPVRFKSCHHTDPCLLAWYLRWFEDVFAGSIATSGRRSVAQTMSSAGLNLVNFDEKSWHRQRPQSKETAPSLVRLAQFARYELPVSGKLEI
jgi:hypothetical protein